MLAMSQPRLYLVPVEVDAVTFRRLCDLASEAGREPHQVGGELIRDVLQDDAEAHQRAEPAPARALN